MLVLRSRWRCLSYIFWQIVIAWSCLVLQGYAWRGRSRRRMPTAAAAVTTEAQLEALAGAAALMLAAVAPVLAL